MLYRSLTLRDLLSFCFLFSPDAGGPLPFLPKMSVSPFLLRLPPYLGKRYTPLPCERDGGKVFLSLSVCHGPTVPPSFLLWRRKKTLPLRIWSFFSLLRSLQTLCFFPPLISSRNVKGVFLSAGRLTSSYQDTPPPLICICSGCRAG